MSNKTFAVVVAAIIVLLAAPLVPHAIKPKPDQPTDKPSLKTPTQPDIYNRVPATVAPAQPAARPRPSIMTQVQFNQIRPGMTYAQCVQLTGSEGKPAGRDPGGGEQRSWQLVDDPSGTVSRGEAILTFRNGILSGKGFNSNAGRTATPAEMMAMMANSMPAQRPATPPYICRSVYDGMKNGCSYTDCVQLLGMEGRYLGRRAMSAGTRAPNGALVPATADVFVWQNASNQTTLTLSFRDGKLSAREISSGSGAGRNFGGRR